MDASGRHYVDHYKVVIDGDGRSYENWDQLLVLLKTNFHAYPDLLKW